MVVQEIKALGLQPDVCTYGTAIDACAKLAANALNEVHQQHYITGSPVMTRTPDGDRAVESAVALFGEMKAQGLKPNEVSSTRAEARHNIVLPSLGG